MDTKELRAYLKTVPGEKAEEIRLARMRAARRSYRERHLDKEKRRQADWYRRKREELERNPEQLLLLRERDAERKRRERSKD
jgi:hypothetical protein